MRGIGHIWVNALNISGPLIASCLDALLSWHGVLMLCYLVGVDGLPSFVFILVHHGRVQPPAATDVVEFAQISER